MKGAPSTRAGSEAAAVVTAPADFNRSRRERSRFSAIGSTPRSRVFLPNCNMAGAAPVVFLNAFIFFLTELVEAPKLELNMFKLNMFKRRGYVYRRFVSRLSRNQPGGDRLGRQDSVSQ